MDTLKILIVDDNEGSRRLLRAYLLDHGEIVIAESGKDAVDIFEQAIESGKRFDLVCLDYMMPGMDGIETLEAMRHIEREHQIERIDRTKIIMTTVAKDDADVQKAFLSGCDAYIIKPERKERILNEIRNFGLIA